MTLCVPKISSMALASRVALPAARLLRPAVIKEPWTKFSARTVRARVDAMMSAAPPAGAAAALRGRAQRPDYRALLAGLDIPALVCTGSADPWSDQAVTAEIIAHLKRPEPVVINGVGHLPNLEAQDEFNDILRAFLRAHAPG
jgi:pimeloyl-ACP methyl ester carboxylesterase